MSNNIQTLVKWVEALIISIWAVLAPVHAVIISTMAATFADLVTGVWAAHKQKIPITSSGLRRTVTKIFVYQIAIILGFVIEKYLLSDAIPVVKLASGMIGMVELKSVFENLDIISEKDLFKTLLEKLNSFNSKDDHAADK